MSKPINKLSKDEATKALLRELAWKAKGLSYSGRRIGALRQRLAIFNVTVAGPFPIPGGGAQ